MHYSRQNYSSLTSNIRGATTFSKLGVQFLGITNLYIKNRQVYPVWCSRLHKHTLFKKAMWKLGESVKILGRSGPPEPTVAAPVSKHYLRTSWPPSPALHNQTVSPPGECPWTNNIYRVPTKSMYFASPPFPSPNTGHPKTNPIPLYIFHFHPLARQMDRSHITHCESKKDQRHFSLITLPL